MKMPRRSAFAEIEAVGRYARRWRAIFFSAVAAVTVFLWVSFTEHTLFEQGASLRAVRAVRERDTNLAAAVNHYILRILKNAEAVNGMVREVHTVDADEQRLRSLLQGRVRANDAMTELGLCLQDGGVLSTAPPGAAMLVPATCASLARRMTNSSGLQVAGMVRSASGGRFVALATPLAGNAGAGMTVALVASETLLGVMASARLRDDTLVQLRGTDGTVLSSWHSAARSASASVAPRASLAPDPSLDGRPRLLTHYAMTPWNLNVVVATLEADALQEFHARRGLYFVFCIVATAALLAVALLLTRLHAFSTQQAKSLGVARGDLQKANQQLEDEVRERTSQLSQAYQDLETFSVAVAHDVRAPLAAIEAFAEVLEPDIVAGGNERHVRYIRRIRVNAQHMDKLTGHLLELGKLTATPLVLGPVDLAGIAAEIVERQRDVQPDRRVETSIEVPLRVLGDAGLLRQVLDNLLGNAWKFSAGRDPARIEVRQTAFDAAGWTLITVCDNGAGFDRANATGLFAPFRRMHSADEFPGTGIGLATAQRIIGLHGGKIWCESRPGEGATFSFTLRLADHAEANTH